VTATLGLWIRRQPRASAAIAFGIVTALVTHVAWVPAARMSGAAPILTLAAGAAHAIAGAITGRRLIDRTRTRTGAEACVLGAATSLLALVILAPPLASWVAAGNARPEGVFSYLALTVLVGVFSFLGAGWALLVASAGVGWGLHRLADRPAAA
jgi:hypothetical protein